MSKLYRIKWVAPNSKKVHVGPVLFNTYKKRFYTLKEVKKICARFNKNSDVVHTVHDSTPIKGED